VTFYDHDESSASASLDIGVAKFPTANLIMVDFGTLTGDELLESRIP
jgi:hypothetical protein